MSPQPLSRLQWADLHIKGRSVRGFGVHCVHVEVYERVSVCVCGCGGAWVSVVRVLCGVVESVCVVAGGWSVCVWVCGRVCVCVWSRGELREVTCSGPVNDGPEHHNTPA